MLSGPGRWRRTGTSTCTGGTRRCQGRFSVDADAVAAKLREALRMLAVPDETGPIEGATDEPLRARKARNARDYRARQRGRTITAPSPCGWLPGGDASPRVTGDASPAPVLLFPAVSVVSSSNGSELPETTGKDRNREKQ